MAALLTSTAATQIFYALIRASVIDNLVVWRTAENIAKMHGLDANGTATVLRFLSRSTKVLLQSGRKFRLAPELNRDSSWRGIIEKFVGAYARVLQEPISCLRALDNAGRMVDRAALSRAYGWDSESRAVISAMLDLRPEAILDIGCGRGSLLVEVCTRSTIRAWGIDPSRQMCRIARSAVAAAGLQRQVTIRCAEVGSVERTLSMVERQRVSVIHAGSLLNEFARNEAAIVAILTRLVGHFRGAWLVVVDYLGALGAQVRRADPYTYLTDVVQALAGQGVPPASHKRWDVLYRSAGCRLIRIAESRTPDLQWFIHVVRLG